MLANNPMGSRRRRRFYHRAGVVPIPGDRFKQDSNDPNIYKYEPEPANAEDPKVDTVKKGAQPCPHDPMVQPIRRVKFISVMSLHCRLLDIVESVIALGEAEERKIEKLRAALDAAEKADGKAAGKSAGKDAGEADRPSSDQAAAQADQDAESAEQGNDKEGHATDEGPGQASAVDDGHCVK